MQPADSMVMFGKDISDKSADWAIWRRTPMTWLRLGKKHSEAGHIVLSADCFNEVRSGASMPAFVILCLLCKAVMYSFISGLASIATCTGTLAQLLDYASTLSL